MANLIKVEVDLSEMYSDEDSGSFTEEIKKNISYSVRQEVWKSFKESAFEEFSKKIKEEFEGEKEKTIQETIQTFFKEKKVKEYGSEYNLEQYIEKKVNDYFFNNDNLARLLDTSVKKQAEICSNQIKERYDLLFASQIVTKLGENGFLKDNIAELLLKK